MRQPLAEQWTGRMHRDVDLLSALGNETRYRLVRAIAAESDGICVCDLETAVDVGQSAISQALARLAAADLVTRRKVGRWRYYSATDRARAVLAALDETGGRPDA